MTKEHPMCDVCRKDYNRMCKLIENWEYYPWINAPDYLYLVRYPIKLINFFLEFSKYRLSYCGNARGQLEIFYTVPMKVSGDYLPDTWHDLPKAEKEHKLGRQGYFLFRIGKRC